MDMKKFITTLRITYVSYILSLIVICLTSCAGTKKLEKSKIDSSNVANTNLTKKTDETQTGSVTDKSEKTQDKNTSKVKETKVTDYDPSKPIVSGTGKPPVVKETVTTEKDETQETITQKLNLQIDYTRQLKQTINSQNSIISKLKAKTETKVTTVSNWYKWLLFGLILGSALTILIYQLKWYEIVWNFIKKAFRR